MATTWEICGTPFSFPHLLVSSILAPMGSSLLLTLSPFCILITCAIFCLLLVAPPPLLKPQPPWSRPKQKKLHPSFFGEMKLQQCHLIRRSGKANKCPGDVRLSVQYVKEFSKRFISRRALGDTEVLVSPRTHADERRRSGSLAELSEIAEF